MTTTEICAAACDGPIVMLNVSDYRSDALVVRTHGIDAVRLPLTSETMNTNGVRFLAALNIVMDPRASGNQRAEAGATIRRTLQWLWDVIAGPVLSHLGLAEPPTGSQRGRLWWVPSTLLTFLPLHAAERVDGDTSVSALDMVESSYTPTVRALRHARDQHAEISGSAGPLVVAMPETPGQCELPGAREEVELIIQRFPGAVALVGEEATKDAVLDKLPHHPWVHVTCHGVSDLEDPSRSFLQISGTDGELTVLDITHKHIVGELAFLSACGTGQPGLALIDETIHLASAFQLAGYRHVLASMWPIFDKIAVQVAADVYKSISPGSRSVAQLATTLAAAVRSVRESCPDEPWVWASYVHVGP